MSAVSTMDRELTKRTVIGAEEGINREDGKEGQRTSSFRCDCRQKASATPH